jgi:CRISPR associated protein Cas1
MVMTSSSSIAGNRAAANLYWSAWGSVEVAFVRRELARVPEHWRVMEGRRSAVNVGTARNATDPINAMANYLYRLVEAEERLAALATGLEPSLGVLHADLRGRDSFVLDVMEATRPIAERYLLRLIQSTTFRRRDFVEDARGVVRVMPPLAHTLADAMPSFGAALGPVMEHVANLFAAANPYDVSTPSVLTRSKHVAAARRRADRADDIQRTNVYGPGSPGLAPRGKRRQKPLISPEPPLPLPVCRGCGAGLTIEPERTRPRRVYCTTCLVERRAELGSDIQARSLVDAENFARRTGIRPTHTADATAKRKEANSARRAEQALWEAEHADEVYDPVWFVSVVAPKLVTITLPTIARAPGMSTSAAAKVRAGRRLPHPRHWPALAALVGVELPSGTLD